PNSLPPRCYPTLHDALPILTPISPRSQVLSTGRRTNGSGSRRSPLTTRSAPVCSQTNTRPSGATARAVQPVSPVTTGVTVNPGRSEEHTSELQSPDHLVSRL